MNILLNARPLNTVFTGVARYVRTLYQHITRLELARVGYFCGGRVGAEMPRQTSDAIGRHLPAWVRDIARMSRAAIEDRLLDRQFRSKLFDVYHETGMFPLTTSAAVPTVMTIYDLSLITHPECHPPDRVRHFRRYFYKRLSAADHIITISEFVKAEILTVLDLPPERVTAIPLAASGVFSRRPEDQVSRYLAANGLTRPYVLSVGTREPRKNLTGLVRAYASIDTDVPLLCVGWAGWMNEDLPVEIERQRLKGTVRLLGHVEDEDLAVLYSGAMFSVYPSIYEGFGLPILEAMACGCPVVTSDCSSMPEVAGGAAHLIDPLDDRDIARGVSKMMSDEALRKSCVAKGTERAGDFSWERTARRTVDVLRRASIGLEA